MTCSTSQSTKVGQEPAKVLQVKSTDKEFLGHFSYFDALCAQPLAESAAGSVASGSEDSTEVAPQPPGSDLLPGGV